MRRQGLHPVGEEAGPLPSEKESRASTLPPSPPHNKHPGPAQQEKGQGTDPGVATGSPLEPLPLPHILSHSWRSRSISQVQITSTLGSLDGAVVDFVKLLHDKLQVRAEVWSRRKAPEQSGQVQEYGKQQQDVGEELKSKGQSW